MKIRFVTCFELHENLSLYGLGGTWYGAYFGGYAEILIDKELNIYRVVTTVIHEIIHWLIDVIGLRYKHWDIDDWFDLFVQFIDVTRPLGSRRDMMAEYWARIRKPHP